VDTLLLAAGPLAAKDRVKELMNIADDEPDYSRYTGYTLEELRYVRDRVDQEKDPERALRLDEEIARRVMLQATPQLTEPPRYLSLEFHGSAQEYFRVWIVNLCLSLLTLGIFSAWAKVRKKRYIYSHTTLDGTPFQYLGRPVPILKGRLIAGIAFAAYYISSHFMTSLLPYILGVGVVAAPWVIARSAAFNARYSAFRNMTLHFDGGYLDTVKMLYAWGILPAFAIGMVFGWSGTELHSAIIVTILGLASVVFGISFPWLIKRLKKFIVEHTSFGGRKGSFTATGGQFFKVYLISGLITMAVAIPSFIIAGILIFSTGGKSGLSPLLGVLPLYAGYVLAYAFVQSRSGNLVWNHTRLGPISFQSILRWWDLVKLYVTNALGIIVSLGLLIPWAVIRTLKYRVDKMRVVQEGDLAQFQGSDRDEVAAIGAETVDFFDVDLSL
jgi:uncharacterized membrane protein YjgN (DUF898 family)